eukprot:2490797-Rhodomonas_salina.1
MTADTLLSPSAPPRPLPLSHTHHKPRISLSASGRVGSGAGHVIEVVEDFSGAEDDFADLVRGVQLVGAVR